MNRSESIKELATALAKAQGEMENPKFDTQNPFFKNRYASLAAVRNTVLPVFSRNGLSVVQSLRSTESGVDCETMLMHNSGEWIADTLSMPVSKHDAQGYGSAGTYARRYSLMAISGVVGDEDDDANAAANKDDKKDEKKSKKIPPPLPALKDVLDAIAKMTTKPERDATKALADQLTDEAQVAMAEEAWAKRIEELRQPAKAQSKEV